MRTWIQRLGLAVERLEHRADKAWFHSKRKLGTLNLPVIVAYASYGNAERLYLSGRVLADSGLRGPLDHDTVWNNARMMYRRFASDEIAGALVEGHLNSAMSYAETDKEGYFTLQFQPDEPLPQRELWHTVRLHLARPRYNNEVISGTGRIMVPLLSARFGVISDMDDTVVHTDVNSVVKMARIVFLGNARTRLPFPGIAAFYRALHGGISGAEGNPIFYLSSSPWNYYDIFHDFLALQNIPTGPLLLRDWGVSANEFLPLSHQDYKLAGIRRILDFYPHLPFMLVGDSSQEDPEIYLRVVQEYGARILAVYIRNVRADLTERASAIQKLFTETAVAGVPLQLVPDTLAAARDAAERGWINHSAVAEIAGETRKDKAPPTQSPDIVDEKKDRPLQT